MPLSPRHVVPLVALISAAACGGRDARSTVTVQSQRLTLTALPSPTGTRAAEPFLSTAPDGRLLLSWLQREPDSVTVVMRVASLGSGDQWSQPGEVVRSTKLFVNWADFPSVVPLADGTLLAHWLQKNGAGAYAYDVRLASSRDSGRTWTRSVTPHGEGVQAEHGFVTLLPRADSSADIVFLNGREAPPHDGADGGEHRGPPMRLAHARWTTGSKPITADAQILDERTCDCCQTAAAITTRGPVALYRDRSETEVRDISVTRLVDGAWTAPAPLHVDDWVIDACPVNGPAIAANGDRVAAVWFTGARDTAKVQLVFSSDAGVTFGKPVRIDGGMPAGRVDVELLDGGDALVTWIERTAKDAAEVRARIVSSAGVAEAPLTITTIKGGRASGFPRMTRRGRDVALAWTVPASATSPSTIELATLRITPR
ncbi:MAG TPA: hypothetical protein VE861_15990 [Gemmatimonadaceae bacterium]|nr:hypothetical protein [Gemmatimonadaceae bacterium]